MNKYKLINCDSDGACFGLDNQEIDISSITEQLELFNATLPECIEVEFESFIPALAVAKPKNYAMLDDKGNVVIKGSAFKSSSKEPALKEMCSEILKSMLGLRDDTPQTIYLRYVKEAANIKDIKRWCSKITLTPAVMKAGRLQERKKLAAAEGLDLQLGDKYFTYIKPDEWLGVPEAFDGNYHVNKYIKKVHNAVKPLAQVIDIKEFPNYGLVKNKVKLEELAG